MFTAASSICANLGCDLTYIDSDNCLNVAKTQGQYALLLFFPCFFTPTNAWASLSDVATDLGNKDTNFIYALKVQLPANYKENDEDVMSEPNPLIPAVKVGQREVRTYVWQYTTTNNAELDVLNNVVKQVESGLFQHCMIEYTDNINWRRLESQIMINTYNSNGLLGHQINLTTQWAMKPSIDHIVKPQYLSGVFDLAKGYCIGK